MLKLLLLLYISIRVASYGNIVHKRYMYSSKLSLSSSPLSPQIPSSLPVGCIIARNNNLNEEQLEIIDDIIFNTVNQQFQPPVFICGKNDMKLTLNKILIDKAKDNSILLHQKDHEIPNDKLSLSVKNVPVILLSGFDRPDAKSIIISIKTWNGPNSGTFPKIAFAIVVQPALSKTLDDLFNEILRDFSEDKLKS